MKKRLFSISVLLLIVIGIVPNSATLPAGAVAGQVCLYLPLIHQAVPTPEVLPTGLVHPTSLVVDSLKVYWTNGVNQTGDPADGTIMAYSKSLGTMQTLGSDLSWPHLLQADADALYWVNRRWIPGMGVFTIFRMPKSGGQPVELATYQHVNGSLAVDESYVYWRDYSSAVMRLPKMGGEAPQVAPIPALVFDGPDAYWLSGGLVRSNKDGSNLVILVKDSDLQHLGGRPYSLVSIMDIFPGPNEIYFSVYVDNNPGMLGCTDQSTILMKVPRNGGAFVALASAAGRASFFVTRPFAYTWGDCMTPFQKLDLSHQPAGTVAVIGGMATAMAEDSAFVYGSDTTGTRIVRILK